MSAKQNKMIKAMDAEEWDRAMAHLAKRQESVASFATRAFRQMRERDEAGPQYVPPAAGQPVQANQGANQGAALPVPLMIETVGELAALMQGAAAMASAARLKLPSALAREAVALARASVGSALQAARVERFGNRPRGEQPEALRLANERRSAAARERQA